ncbi:MAG: RsmG family class I SAM-dependent methyltransferase [Myxococcales bacterium]
MLRSPWPLPRACPPQTRTALTTWLEQLETWNQRIDLTAARSREELCDLMVADALELSSRLPSGLSVVDVGTGAGAPGLALAVLRPDLRVTLVEPKVKRLAFLRTVLGVLERSDVRLVQARVQGLVEHAWDVAMARATFAPAEWLSLGRRLVVPGGSVWVLLAREAPPEDGFVEESSYTWPNTGVRRRLVRYETNPNIARLQCG